MTATDELRRIAAKTECANGRCEKLYRGDLDHIADRIDAEHQKAIRELNNFADASVLLPVDADGVPIHVGDELEIEHNGRVTTVDVMTLLEQGWTVYCTSGGAFVPTQTRCHHVQPDSWERIIEDAANFALDTQHTARRISLEPFVERCRRLAGERA